jgi:spore maturation protein CgeB
MRVALFYHSLVSDWNHGNAHFLRGVASELQSRGHQVLIFEPEDGWSRLNLLADRGPDAIAAFERAFPTLKSLPYDLGNLRLDEWLDGVDLVIVHEWNHPRLVSAIGKFRKHNRHLRALFHDTHHRAFSAEDEIRRFELLNYDGVLAYGASLKETYERQGWGRQVFVWHEAADVRVFYPRTTSQQRDEVVWIGNWGDEERTDELREYFIHPVRNLRLRAQVFGVRYPESAIRELARASISYGGSIANFDVPAAFAEYKLTVHVPRRPYVEALPGIPTIRPFEALACGIPLVSAPWQDSENLFRVGDDFLMAHNGNEMERHIRAVLNDPALAASLRSKGFETIRTRHTCRHRVDELLAVFADLTGVSHEALTAGAHGR